MAQCCCMLSVRLFRYVPAHKVVLVLPAACRHEPAVAMGHMASKVGDWRHPPLDDLVRKANPVITTGTSVQTCPKTTEALLCERVAMVSVNVLSEVHEARNIGLVINVYSFTACCSPSSLESDAEAGASGFGNVQKNDWNG